MIKSEYESLHRHIELLCGGLDYTHISLMRYEPVDIVLGDTRLLRSCFKCSRKSPGSELVYLSAVLIELVHPLIREAVLEIIFHSYLRSNSHVAGAEEMCACAVGGEV